MSEKFEGALCGLCKAKTIDDRTLLKILSIIKKGIEWPKDKQHIIKLRQKGCLKKLVLILQTRQRHKSVLDVTLSILGNCVMDNVCSREVVEHNIWSALDQVLIQFPNEDSIRGRIFRIIGNMCKHKDQLGNTIVDRKPELVNHIVDFIKKISKDDIPSDEHNSEATIMMAIRSLRVLLNCQTIITLVKTHGVLKAVGSLFIKYSLEWEENKKNENLLNNIIRLFLDYSRYKYYQSILDMKSTDRGDSFIHLSNVLVLAPKEIVKIVMNFIKISYLKSELPVPEICDRFVEALKKHPIIKEFDGECVEYLQCLCYLLDHPANRNNGRCGNSIPLLIQLLLDFKEPSNKVFECCILLIATLNKCRYDESLMLEQLKCNVIPILVKKLQWLVGESNTLNIEHKHIKKRKYDHSNSSISNKRYWSQDGYKSPQSPTTSFRPCSPSSSDDDMDFIRFERSPSPCSSTSDSKITWSSPCSSPQSFVDNESDLDSDNYSPICSEVDGSEFPLPLPEEDEEPLQDNESGKVEEMDDKPITDLDSKDVSMTLKGRLLIEITKLLKTYSKLRSSIPQLASEELLIALLKCSGNFEWTFCYSDTVDLICRILDSHEYLIPLMQTEFIQTIYNLTDIDSRDWCTKCSKYLVIGHTILRKFTALAESGCGKGDIAHKLMRGNDELKQKLVLVIPLIVKNRYVLGKLMLNCGGLEILMKLLREDTELKKRSIKVLCIMASRKLEIASPKDLSTGLNRPKIYADKYKLDENCTNIVTFMLDDGTSLRADRDFLSSKSDFFSRLFNGDFKESMEDIISLHNVESKPLRCLLHLLTCVDKTETIEIDLDLDTLLEVIALSDRYLMVDLNVSLTDSVEQFKMTPETVPVIYRWSLESGTNLLRVESIAFALVENIEDVERYVMFESLFDLGYSEQLVEDIQKLLGRYLTCWMSAAENYNSKRKNLRARLRNLRDNLLKQCI